jgi:hypothetical protein
MANGETSGIDGLQGDIISSKELYAKFMQLVDSKNITFNTAHGNRGQ